MLVTKHTDGRITIECEPADLKSVLAAINGHAVTTLSATRATKAKGRRATKRATKSGTDIGEGWNEKLPLIEGPIKFPMVKKIKKQLQFPGDERTLRSMLVAKRRAA